MHNINHPVVLWLTIILFTVLADRSVIGSVGLQEDLGNNIGDEPVGDSRAGEFDFYGTTLAPYIAEETTKVLTSRPSSSLSTTTTLMPNLSSSTSLGPNFLISKTTEPNINLTTTFTPYSNSSTTTTTVPGNISSSTFSPNLNNSTTSKPNFYSSTTTPPNNRTSTTTSPNMVTSTTFEPNLSTTTTSLPNVNSSTTLIPVNNSSTTTLRPNPKITTTSKSKRRTTRKPKPKSTKRPIKRTTKKPKKRTTKKPSVTTRRPQDGKDDSKNEAELGFEQVVNKDMARGIHRIKPYIEAKTTSLIVIRKLEPLSYRRSKSEPDLLFAKVIITRRGRRGEPIYHLKLEEETRNRFRILAVKGGMLKMDEIEYFD